MAREKRRLLLEVCAALDLPMNVANVLLLRCRWDAEKLVDMYTRDGPEALSASGHRVAHPSVADDGHVSTPVVTLNGGGAHRGSSSTVAGEEADDDVVECLSCMDEFPLSDMWSLDCGHAFCKSCWEVCGDAFFSCSVSCVLACSTCAPWPGLSATCCGLRGCSVCRLHVLPARR